MEPTISCNVSVSANFWLSVVSLKYPWKGLQEIIKSVQRSKLYSNKGSSISMGAAHSCTCSNFLPQTWFRSRTVQELLSSYMRNPFSRCNVLNQWGSYYCPDYSKVNWSLESELPRSPGTFKTRLGLTLDHTVGAQCHFYMTSRLLLKKQKDATGSPGSWWGRWCKWSTHGRVSFPQL